jgi:hypothetical protein
LTRRAGRSPGQRQRRPGAQGRPQGQPPRKSAAPGRCLPLHGICLAPDHWPARRRGFDESPNDALRRLLRHRKPEAEPATAIPSSPPRRKSWSDQGVTLPHGTAIRTSYNRRTYEGQIVNGSWAIGEHNFDSPSGAASGVAVTKRGNARGLTAGFTGKSNCRVRTLGNPSIACAQPGGSRLKSQACSTAGATFGCFNTLNSTVIIPRQSRGL